MKAKEILFRAEKITVDMINPQSEQRWKALVFLLQITTHPRWARYLGVSSSRSQQETGLNCKQAVCKGVWRWGG